MKLKALFGVAMLAGCASHPQPTQNLASSIAAVQGAETSGAANVPEAKLYLQTAKEEVATAQAMMKHGKNARADLMTRRAYSDAELALSLTQEHQARLRAEQAAQFARSQQSSVATSTEEQPMMNSEPQSAPTP
jgi:hypothetical protein